MGCRGKGFYNFLIDFLGNVVFTTGENIYCRVLVLGPGVNGDVAFCYNDDTTETIGAKLMNDGVDDGCSSCFCTVDKGL